MGREERENINSRFSLKTIKNEQRMTDESKGKRYGHEKSYLIKEGEH